MNSTFHIGRLTKDPELKKTASNIPYCTFTLAVDRPKNPTTGESKADFIPFKAWQKRAEIAAQYLQKGSMVAIRGNIQTSSFDAQDGTKRYVTEVVVDEMKFLDGNKKSSPAAEPESPGFSPEAYGVGTDRFVQVNVCSDELPF